MSSLETSKLLISALQRTSAVTGFLYVHRAVMDSQKSTKMSFIFWTNLSNSLLNMCGYDAGKN